MTTRRLRPPPRGHSPARAAILTKRRHVRSTTVRSDPMYRDVAYVHESKRSHDCSLPKSTLRQGGRAPFSPCPIQMQKTPTTVRLYAKRGGSFDLSSDDKTRAFHSECNLKRRRFFATSILQLVQSCATRKEIARFSARHFS